VVRSGTLEALVLELVCIFFEPGTTIIGAINALLLVWIFVVVYSPGRGLSMNCWFYVLIYKFFDKASSFGPGSVTLVEVRGVRSR
jgi:hypothetical protein